MVKLGPVNVSSNGCMCVYIIPYSLQIPTDDIKHEDDKSVRQIMIAAGRTLSFER